MVKELDPELPIADVRTMEARVAESLARRRFAMVLLGGFAAVALILVMAGLYGVMTYITNHRRHEFGVRLTLGASPRDLLALVLSQGFQVTVFGILVGMLMAGALSRLIAAQLFEVEPVAPGIYVAAALVMASVAAIACALPAVRASRLDPAATLRHD